MPNDLMMALLDRSRAFLFGSGLQETGRFWFEMAQRKQCISHTIPKHMHACIHTYIHTYTQRRLLHTCIQAYHAYIHARIHSCRPGTEFASRLKYILFLDRSLSLVIFKVSTGTCVCMYVCMYVYVD